MRRGGFTLTEILLAIIILAVCVLGLLPLIAVATRAHKRAVDNAVASEIARQVLAEASEKLTEANPGALFQRLQAEHGKSRVRLDTGTQDVILVSDVPVKGRPDGFRVDFRYEPLRPVDPANSGYQLKMTVKWMFESQEQTWEFHTVLVRKSPHVDLAGAPPPVTAPPSRPRAHDPLFEFATPAAAVVPESDLQLPPMAEVQAAILEVTQGQKIRPWLGRWQTWSGQRLKTGVAFSMAQELKGIKDPTGRTLYGVNVGFVFHPLESAGLKNLRLLHITKTETQVDGRSSDLNSQGMALTGHRSEGDPFSDHAKVVPRDEDGKKEGLAAEGILGWETRAIGNPWSGAQNFELRIVWSGMTWVIGTNAEGRDQPVGYFLWRAAVDGKVGYGPTDTNLKGRLEASNFVESKGDSGTGNDAILRKYLK